MVAITEERLLTLSEVSRLLDVTPVTLRSWFHRGLMEASRLPNGHLRIREGEVIRLKEGLPLEAQA